MQQATVHAFETMTERNNARLCLRRVGTYAVVTVSLASGFKLYVRQILTIIASYNSKFNLDTLYVHDCNFHNLVTAIIVIFSSNMCNP